MKLHSYLRGRLVDLGIDLTHLGRLLKPSLGVTSISQRMNCHKAWKTTEMYQIMQITNEPHENLHLMFPCGGVKANSKENIRLIRVKKEPPNRAAK